MSIITRGGDLRGQGEGTKVKATKTSGGGGGGTPVRHTIPLGIVIFLVLCRYLKIFFVCNLVCKPILIPCIL